MGRRFYGFNNRFKTTKNTEAIVFENGGFVGNLGLVKNYGRNILGDLANKINFDLLNTFFNHQHEMTRSSSVNKTTMKNILNDGRDISIAKLVENTSLIIK